MMCIGSEGQVSGAKSFFLGLVCFSLLSALPCSAWAQDPSFSSMPPLPEASDIPVVSEQPVPSDAELGQSDSSASVPSLTDAIGKVVGSASSSVDIPMIPSPGMGLPMGDPSVPPGIQGGPQPDDTQGIRRQAYEAMMSGLMPLQADELREAFNRLDVNQKAIEEPLSYPKPVVAFTTISLDPGQVPITLKLATGHVTTVSFLDVTGEPWPIADMAFAGNFEVNVISATDNNPKDGNMLRIIPMSEYAYGNVSLRLSGLGTPVVFTMKAGNRDAVQYRLDIRVPAEGPFAKPSLIEQASFPGFLAGDRSLSQIMDGVPPSDAEVLAVSGAGVDGRTMAYRMNGMVYLRTPLTLLSPGWQSSVRSADGTNVYQIDDAPVLVLSDDGRMVRAQIDDGLKGENDE